MRTRFAMAGAFALIALGFLASPLQATIYLFNVSLTGPSESPANASPGFGSGSATYDNVAKTLALSVTFTGLTGTTSASHLHAATTTSGVGTPAQASAALNAGVATTTPSLSGFPLGVTSGAYAGVLDLTLASSYNPAYVTANGGTTSTAEAALASAMFAGKTYWNIHSSTFGGGEIRGFLTLIPEPATASMLTVAGLAVVALRRRK